jgi:hypothetical protein
MYLEEVDVFLLAMDGNDDVHNVYLGLTGPLSG